MGYKIKDLYEWFEDSANSRSILEALQTGKQFIFSDDGTFKAPAVDTSEVVDGAGVSHTGELEDASHDHSGETINPDVVNTNRADITDSYVEANRTSDSGSISSGTYTNIVDNVVTDANGDWNGSNQFVAPRSGRFVIYSQIQLFDGTDGDSVNMRVRDVTAGTDVQFETVSFNYFHASNDNGYRTIMADMTSGNAHEVQFRNSNSSCKVSKGQTWLIIQPQVVHP